MGGCQIGEATNPGPPAPGIRPEGVSEAVVESLEQALTALDTDEAPQDWSRSMRRQCSWFVATRILTAEVVVDSASKVDPHLGRSAAKKMLSGV